LNHKYARARRLYSDQKGGSRTSRSSAIITACIAIATEGACS
jgi:hypothetical protein